MTLSTSAKMEILEPMQISQSEEAKEYKVKEASRKQSQAAKRSILSRPVLIYLGVSLFCLVFFLIYNLFSHGVTSPYMTFLFAFPLLLGAGVLLGMEWLELPKASFLASFLYNGGLAAMICSSCIRGLTDIAGTYSSMQSGLMIFGAVMLSLGVLCYMPSLLTKSEEQKPGKKRENNYNFNQSQNKSNASESDMALIQISQMQEQGKDNDTIEKASFGPIGCEELNNASAAPFQTELDRNRNRNRNFSEINIVEENEAKPAVESEYIFGLSQKPELPAITDWMREGKDRPDD